MVYEPSAPPLPLEEYHQNPSHTSYPYPAPHSQTYHLNKHILHTPNSPPPPPPPPQVYPNSPPLKNEAPYPSHTQPDIELQNPNIDLNEHSSSDGSVFLIGLLLGSVIGLFAFLPLIFAKRLRIIGQKKTLYMRGVLIPVTIQVIAIIAFVTLYLVVWDRVW